MLYDIVRKRNQLPEGIEYDGKRMRVGVPNLNNIYRYNWVMKENKGNWSYQYTVNI